MAYFKMELDRIKVVQNELTKERREEKLGNLGQSMPAKSDLRPGQFLLD